MFNTKNVPPFEELKSAIKRGERWYTTPLGVAYPSVTTILGAEDKPGLAAWKTALGPAKAKKETDRCSERGTAVHLMVEHFLNNVDLDDVTRNQTYSNIKIFNQMKTRLKRIDNIRAQEIPLYSNTMKIAGRVDCVAEYDGVLSIIDFKTSNNTKDVKMVHDYFLQCTAYAIMYSELFNEAIEDIVVIIGVEKGAMPMVYRKKIDDYVKPLLKRISKFYSTRTK